MIHAKYNGLKFIMTIKSMTKSILIPKQLKSHLFSHAIRIIEKNCENYCTMCSRAAKYEFDGKFAKFPKFVKFIKLKKRKNNMRNAKLFKS